MPTFISDEVFDRLVPALSAIQPCPFTGDRSAKIAEILCCAGGIWPESLRDGFIHDEDSATNQNEGLTYRLANYSACSQNID